MGNTTIAFGEIHSVNETNYTAVVKLDESDGILTGDLQIMTSMSYLNKNSELPHPKTPCIVLMFDDSNERGVVIGGRFSDMNPCDLSKGKKIINYQKSKITINEDGAIEVECDTLKVKSKTINITAEKTVITSAVEINGTVSISEKLTLKKGLSSSGGVGISESGNIDMSGKISTKEIVSGKRFVEV